MVGSTILVLEEVHVACIANYKEECGSPAALTQNMERGFHLPDPDPGPMRPWAQGSIHPWAQGPLDVAEVLFYDLVRGFF